MPSPSSPLPSLQSPSPDRTIQTTSCTPINPNRAHTVTTSTGTSRLSTMTTKSSSSSVHDLSATDFGAIEAVLKDAEERQVKEANVKLWLDKLKDASYEVEDVLDEWNTEILRVQLEKQERKAGNAVVTTKKKVCLCIPTAFFRFGLHNRVIRRYDIAQKIKEINGKLALIASEQQKYNFQYTKSGTEQIERQKTTSFVDESFGRVDERELLVSMLLSETSKEAETTPIVISIVGMGGIGKTTLAQLAYNDERVRANFTKTIWVCVSDPFDEINIAKAIIEKLNKNDAPNSNDLQPLLECVDRNIKDKKFLLVLDDVWNEDNRKWETLRRPLKNGAIGSKIIVTTRKEEVAMMMGAPDKTINLKVMSDENCWLLFRQIAFTNRKQDECKFFEPIGKEIVKKCKGLPLVAKTLGGLMRYKKTKKEWQNVLSDKIWELEVVEQQVFQPLLLSYYDLAPMIKHCLLYCVIFPKDHKIGKKILIEMWMSQGYLSLVGKKENTMQDIGELYFDHLVMRSFFQDIEKDEIENISFCKMHDIVHDFLQFLTKEEYFAIESKGGEERTVLPAGNKYRHLTITFAGRGLFPVSFDYNCKSLRTITSFDCEITSLGNPESILQLKYVRTLNLSNNRLEEVPKEIGGLVHLRYLDLSQNQGLKKLPDTVCNLINLQTLRLEDCGSLEELPEDMGKLTNLRHLHVWRCWELKLPKTIGRLTSVETLDWVNIWGHDDVIDNNEAVFKLSDLRNMDHLNRSLGIYWRKEWKDAASDADKAKLVNKKHLLSLELSFWSAISGSMIQDETLSALQPNPNLESLEIWNYSGTTLCPHWMKNMNNLTLLVFFQCGVCEVVPLSVLGNLGSLETLTFEYMDKVKKVEFENSTSSSSLEQVLFPSLKHLEFSWIVQWEEWSDLDQESDCVAMPCLSTLEITRCPNLKALPHFLRKTQLQELSIWNSEILSQSCKNTQGKEWPPNIRIDGKTVQKDGVWIQQE
ncbi:hypothetical protein M0R45_031531 [Rubus argutus]|uniref:P-loop containing nucleoside triphosphate hydrolase, leucine-rich repeat domain, L n=1 Tax=Rubus argutus TaxID=59490 RepID=A0AAW1WEX4_RUBAR